MPNPQNKIIFTAAQHKFLKDNYKSLTNKQLSAALGLKITRVRIELYALGLQRIKLERWTKDQEQFLKDNYRKIGNVELAKVFTEKYPKEKGWSSSHISKKLKQLGLHRNKMNRYVIKERNRRNGSFGNINPKNNPSPPKMYFYLDSRTRIVIKPTTDIEKLKEKFASRNGLLL